LISIGHAPNKDSLSCRPIWINETAYAFNMKNGAHAGETVNAQLTSLLPRYRGGAHSD
jgi:hypothetical protein